MSTRMLRSLRRPLLTGLFLLLTAAPIEAQTQEVVEYYAVDALGSVRVVFDAAGAVTARSDYLPFGEAWAPSGNLPAQRFTGQQRDAEEGWDHFNARNLLRTGRFNRVDPIGGNPASPQSWNRYSYVLNNPLNMTDPTGMLAEGFCSAEHSAEDCGAGGAFTHSGYSDTWGRDLAFGDMYANALKQGWDPAMPLDMWRGLQASVDAAFAAFAVVKILGEVVGVAFAANVGFDDKVMAATRMSIAAALINHNADNISRDDTSAINHIDSIVVTNDARTYLGATGGGTMTLSVGYVSKSSPAWLASIIAHEGQHYLNAGRFNGQELWKDEASATMTSLRVGRTVGITSHEAEHKNRWLKNQAAMQQHMTRGYRYP